MFKHFILITALFLIWASSIRAAEMNVVSVDSSRWPEIRLIASLPDSDVNPADYAIKIDSEAEGVAALDITGPLADELVSMVVAVDTSRSLTPAYLRSVKEALGSYVDQLEAGEQLALLAFNDNVQLATGFTGSRDVFRQNLEALKLGGTQTELYRSMLYGLELMKNLPGRHHLLVISDGHDEGSYITREQVLQRAQEYNIAISTVGIPGQPTTGGTRYLPDLADLSDRTGGVHLEAGSADNLKDGLRDLLTEQRNLAKGDQGRLYELVFSLDGAPPRTRLTAELSHSENGETSRVNFFLPAPPLDMVAMASVYPFIDAEVAGARPGQTARPVLSSADTYPLADIHTNGRAIESGHNDMWLDAYSASERLGNYWSPQNNRLSTVSFHGGANGLSSSWTGYDQGRPVTRYYDAGGHSGLVEAASFTGSGAVERAGAAGESTPASSWRNPFLWMILALALLGLTYFSWQRGRRARIYNPYEAAFMAPPAGNHAFQPPASPGPPETFPAETIQPASTKLAEDAAASYYLEFPDTGQIFPLNQGVVLIGSAPNNHVVLDDFLVSPRQAELIVGDRECSVTNLDPVSDTKVNGVPVIISHTPLEAGDELIFGRTLVILKERSSKKFS